MYWIVRTVAVLVLGTLLLLAQRKPQGMKSASAPPEAYASLETLQRQVTEVSLTFSGTDHKGHFIGGLAQNDFTILDNFRRQASITFFQSQTNLPLDIALVVDVSSSMAARFDSERSAIDDFLAETIRPNDSGRLFAFNETIKGTLPIERFHSVKVFVRNLTVHCRTGYYAK